MLRNTAGHAADLGLIGRITRGIRDAEFRDLPFRAPFGGDEIAPVRQRQEVLSAALDDAQTALLQFKVANDLGLQQAHRIGGGRIAEAGIEFLRHAGAADDVPPLQNAHPQARHAEIGCAGQSVVTGSDNNGIEIGHHRQSLPSTATKQQRPPRSMVYPPPWIPTGFLLVYAGGERTPSGGSVRQYSSQYAKYSKSLTNGSITDPRTNPVLPLATVSGDAAVMQPCSPARNRSKVDGNESAVAAIDVPPTMVTS